MRLGVAMLVVAVCLPLVVNGQGDEPSARVQVGAETTTAVGDVRQWEIEVDGAAPGSTAGRIVLEGGKLPSGDLGDVRWEASDTGVVGTLLTKDGSKAVSFAGQLDATGKLSGTYTTVAGETGNWAWDGPMPGLGAEAGSPD